MLPLLISDVVVKGEGGYVMLDIPLLDIAPGAKIGVRGPSGAGKSTLLHLLTGLILPCSGSICWGTTVINLLSETQRDTFRRQNFGLIFQDFLLFEELTALANASIAACFSSPAQRPLILKRAADSLQRFGVHLGTRRVDTFSGGERQRVAVARALATDPGVIIADEPTAALDRESADRLLADLLDVTDQAGKTLIMVSHDPKALEHMDQIILIRDGRVRLSPEDMEPGRP